MDWDKIDLYLAFAAGTLSFWLPETNNQAMTGTIEEFEKKYAHKCLATNKKNKEASEEKVDADSDWECKEKDSKEEDSKVNPVFDEEEM